MLLYAQSLEVHTEFATLFLRGILCGPDVAIARATCTALPSSVRLLRLDVHGMHAVDEAARDGIESLVRDWRRDRLGHVIIAAPVEECELFGAADREAGDWTVNVEAVESALLATYL